MALYLAHLFRQQLPSPFAAWSSIEFLTIVVRTFQFMLLLNLSATSIQYPSNLTSPGNSPSPMTFISPCEILPMNLRKKPSVEILKTGDSVMSAHHAPTFLKARPSSSSVCSTPWMGTTHSREFRDAKQSQYPPRTAVPKNWFSANQVNRRMPVKWARGFTSKRRGWISGPKKHSPKFVQHTLKTRQRMTTHVRSGGGT